MHVNYILHVSHRVIYVYSVLSEQRPSEDVLHQINLKFNVTTVFTLKTHKIQMLICINTGLNITIQFCEKITILLTSVKFAAHCQEANGDQRLNTAF